MKSDHVIAVTSSEDIVVSINRGTDLEKLILKVLWDELDIEDVNNFPEDHPEIPPLLANPTVEGLIKILEESNCIVGYSPAQEI